jgi:glycosyltransferase involved in cell wall biosynthesis
MSAVLRVAIGVSSPPPGFLRMGVDGEADVPFRRDEDFPFEDRAVDTIRCGPFIDTLPRASKLKLLLECRRSLRPGGALRIEASDSDLARLARLAGLEAAEGTFLKPDRRVAGDPLVTIAIPAWSAQFFAVCLDSALAQTYPSTEIVVCDDSHDGEIESIVRTRANGRTVRYERNAARLGPRGNFKRCLERSRGAFVKLLCDDDWLAPECVARLLDGFRRAPDIALATSRRQRIDARGGAIADQPATVPIVSADTVIGGRTLANAMIMAGLNMVGEPSTAMFRRADLIGAAPEYFGFDGVPGHGIIDMVSWAALLLKGDAVYLRAALSAFRIHPGQRQHDPAKATRNVQSIRTLQSAWLELGLHDGLQPDRVLAKPFPSDGANWRWQPLLGFAARAIGDGGRAVS